MANITAAMVKSLREHSGLPMMDCKQALAETEGDEEKAMDLLRKRGAAAAEKKAGRATAEGRIGGYIDKEKGIAGLIEIQCETAPVGNNPLFKELTSKVAKHTALAGQANAETIGDEKFVDDDGVTIKDLVNDLINQIRENMKITRVVRVTGRTAIYVHHTGKVGVVIAVEGDGGDDALLNDVCMQIAAMQPIAVTREQVPAEIIEKEKEIAKEQILASDKPENLVDKIMTGKINSWFSEHVLVEQPFVKDGKIAVGKILDQAGIKVISFTRLQVGDA